MVAFPENNAGYSAQVRLWLEVGDRTIRLSHVSRDYIICDEPTTLPECDAVVVVTVDGERVARKVRLVNGMSPNVDRTIVEKIPDVAALAR